MRYRYRPSRIPVILLSAVLVTACTQGQNSGAPVAMGPGTMNVADAAIAGGDPNMALSVTQSVLATDPNNIDALIHEGDAYYALSRCPAAQAAYQLALQKDPRSSAAETGLARCDLKTDPKAAEADLLLALQDDPGNAAAYNDLGVARDLQGNFAGAVEPYQRALTADPTLTAAEVNLGLSLALSGNGTGALQYLGPLATSQSATPKIREDYAAALIASGRAADAKQVLSIDLPPDQVNAAMNGFNAVIAGAQAPLPPPQAAAPPTMAEVPTMPVAATPLAPTVTTSQTTMTTVSAAPAMPPQIQSQIQSKMSYALDNSTAAYTGPSPIPVTASSSVSAPVTAAADPPPTAMTTSMTTAVATSMAAADPPPPIVKPAPAPAVKRPPPAVTVAETTSGPIMVQLAALNSQSDAERAWNKISSAMPALFGQKQPDIKNAVVNGRTFYRLRTGGFQSEVEAAKFCGEVSAAGNACTVASF